MIIAEREFCRSNKIGQHFIAGVALNKSSTVIMDYHNGELQVGWRNELLKYKSNDRVFLSLLFFCFLKVKK